MDHGGDDIGRAWSIADAANECTADTSCMGFNSGGYYKRVASPLQALAGEAVCFYTKRWCTQESAILQSTDCDGDGILDWICTESSTTARGIVRSSAGCYSDDGQTGWPTAPDSYCPSSSIFLTCPRPNYWCEPTEANNNNRWMLRQADCDGDGIVDLVCTDTDGRRGAIHFTSGCQIDDLSTGWPSAPTSFCPSITSTLVRWSTSTPAMDHWGDDINRALPIADAANECTADTSCMGFNSAGYFKRVVSPLQAAGEAACFYTKSGYCQHVTIAASDCQQFAGYTSTPAMDHWGDDIDQAWPIADAANECTADTSCMGFNSDGYYKRVASPLQAAGEAASFYTKNVCPSVLGYTFTEHVDVQGFDMNLVNGIAPPVDSKTANDLGVQCANTPGCQSFNWVYLDNELRS
ncbi:hypothetical protein TSOC_003237 [Tetrabaena socialis]|uniref:Uncharacterized protein n=1 Tax=Tetrabaena socialis TaxID=47790 RepID=A0A2J8ABZ8_9CHLO|nr:hypothetical protein TSOC_003237 [Tetrabaena socialis]|eukprot:PNH10054.1 hypothetical protein TSOC_003237 [Tetrabaena socialis]